MVVVMALYIVRFRNLCWNWRKIFNIYWECLWIEGNYIWNWYGHVYLQTKWEIFFAGCLFEIFGLSILAMR